MKSYLTVDEELYQYVQSVSLREPDLLLKQREEVTRLSMSAMQTPPEEAQFIAWLVQLTSAKRIIEVGVFAGYTTLWMAMALPEDGLILACDIDEDWTSIGRRYWQAAGVDYKIDLRLAPALDTLKNLLVEERYNYYDLIYIDADKENYIKYYEHALKLVRPGGLIAIDNVLWGGSVANSTNQGKDACTLRALNARLYHDPRVTISMLTIGDGLTLLIKN